VSEMSHELVVADHGAVIQPLENPAGFVSGYVAIADELSRVIRDKKLTSQISGKDHVRVEGWTLLGSMLGVFPVTAWTRPIEIDGARVGWEARVEARTRDGAVIGAAEAECLRTESLWKSRDDYALRSMAQTRATSKALRQPLGFVMTLAGFEATPAEEMPADGDKPTKKQLDYLRSLLKKNDFSTESANNVPLDQLSKAQVSEYIEQLKSGGSPVEQPVTIDGDAVDEWTQAGDDIPF